MYPTQNADGHWRIGRPSLYMLYTLLNLDLVGMNRKFERDTHMKSGTMGHTSVIQGTTLGRNKSHGTTISRAYGHV